jgi:hypothetical protein
MFGEFEAPKTNIEPYLKLMTESSKAFAAMQKKGIIKDFHSWTDNTGHFIVFFLFESIEKFAELWNEPDYHKYISEGSMFLENMRLRLMRPAFAPK